LGEKNERHRRIHSLSYKIHGTIGGRCRHWLGGNDPGRSRGSGGGSGGIDSPRAVKGVFSLPIYPIATFYPLHVVVVRPSWLGDSWVWDLVLPSLEEEAVSKEIKGVVWVWAG